MSESRTATTHCSPDQHENTLQRELQALREERDALVTENKRLRQSIDMVPAFIFRKDCRNHILEINRTFAERMQVEPSAWEGRSCDELFPPDIAAGYWEEDQRVIRTGEASGMVQELIELPDGTRRMFETNKIPLKDEAGKVCEILALAVDVDEQFRVQQNLENSERRFRELYEELSQGVVYQDSAGQILMANPAAQEILGVSLEEMRGATSKDTRWQSLRPDGSLFPGEEHPAMEALRTGRRVEHRLMGVYNPRQQRYRWINISAVPLFRPGESKAYQVFASFEDLTQVREAEEKLELYRAAVETSQDLLFVVDREFRFLMANRAYLRVNQRRAEELVGMHIRDVHGEEFYQQVQHFFVRGLQGESHSHEFTRSFPGKPDQYLLIHHVPIFDAQGNVFAVATSATNITRLKASERNLATLLGNMPGMAYRCRNDQHWSMVYVSEGAHKLTGYTPEVLTGGQLPYESLIHPEDRIRVRDAVDSGLRARRHFEVEYRIRTAQDEYRWVWERGIGIGHGEAEVLEGFITDVTARRGLEERLHQEQRVDSLGRLAGGMAHDLNNLLSPILGYCEFLDEDLADQEELQGFVREIARAAGRAAQMTRQLLAFGRRQTLRLAQEDLNRIAQDSRNLLGSVLREDVELSIHTSEQELPCQVDRAQLKQVLVNLALNAREAMPKGGVVRVESGLVELEEGELAGLARGGRFVRLSMIDSGCGMSKEVLERLFEPFYTTKPRTSGSGWGLATAFGIVKQHDGHLWAESQEGKGSSFHVLLPLRGSVEGHPIKGQHKIPAAAGEEVRTVLVVEDEEQVRELTVRFLERMGAQGL